MNIRQAARLAESRDVLWSVNPSTGEREFLYAVYRRSDHEVVCSGDFERCAEYMVTNNSSDLVRVALDEIVEAMAESDGEARCIPDSCEVREWA